MEIDWIALVALLLSIGSLVWQIVDRVRTRARLIIWLSNGSLTSFVGIARTDVMYVSLTAHAINGRIGIRSVDWELEPRPRGFSSSVLEMPGAKPKIDLQGDRPALDSGGTATWDFRFTDNEGRPFDQPVKVTAVVTLVNGKTVRSEPTTLVPAPTATELEQMAKLVQRDEEGDDAA